MTELNDKIRNLQTKLEGLRKTEKQHRLHIASHLCLKKWNTNQIFFEKSSESQRRMRKKITQMLEKIDEHNVVLGKSLKIYRYDRFCTKVTLKLKFLYRS